MPSTFKIDSAILVSLKEMMDIYRFNTSICIFSDKQFGKYNKQLNSYLSCGEEEGECEGKEIASKKKRYRERERKREVSVFI